MKKPFFLVIFFISCSNPTASKNELSIFCQTINPVSISSVYSPAAQITVYDINDSIDSVYLSFCDDKRREIPSSAKYFWSPPNSAKTQFSDSCQIIAVIIKQDSVKTGDYYLYVWVSSVNKKIGYAYFPFSVVP